MRLNVYLIEGREWTLKEGSYVKLKVGRCKSRSRVLKGTENPIWNEEFSFRATDLDDELVVSVYEYDDQQEAGLFSVYAGKFVGRVKIPLWSVATEENQSLPPTCFSVERPKNDGCKLLIALSLHGKGQDASSSEKSKLLNSDAEFAFSHDAYRGPSSFSKMALEVKPMMKTIAGHFERLFPKKEDEVSAGNVSSPEPSVSTYVEESSEETPTQPSFQELIQRLQSNGEMQASPENLQNGILLDEVFVGSSHDLNMAIFSPDSELVKSFGELQGTTEYKEEPWKWKSDCIPSLRRVVSYTKAATKLVKSVKATEEQVYVKADGKEYAVLVDVSIPDAPYGNIFKVELLYKIMPGMESSTGEETTRLVISWAINFSQNTMVRGMIEGGARKGMKENFEQFGNLLSQKFRKAGAAEISGKDQILATVGTQNRSLSLVRYFWNFTFVSTMLMLIYTCLHIFFSVTYPSKKWRFEFEGIDLPDSLGELITGGLLAIQMERVYEMVSHFIAARLRRGSDPGVRAQGEGWILTVALIEASDLASNDPKETLDPFVMLTCNGQTRTSSVKLQTDEPQWDEILEFDALEEPPSVLEVAVFNFEGLFDQASSLGYAEINFLKHSAAQLADIWVPLEGKLAQTSRSKLRLRIFLDNNNGVDTIRDYLSNLEKEVGKKLNLRSPHRTSTFQKIFSLPPEEFLISDFSCSLKRKMPLQGRLFLSARIVGFYANLFGHKTIFFFLWEDIADIQILPPSISTVGSPILVIVLHKGRGLDARHGAKALDDEGRLHFYFHSFVSLNAASRTITALWRTRTSDPAQKMDDDSGGKPTQCQLGEKGAAIVVENVEMSKVYSSQLPTNIASLMKMFDGGEFEATLMRRSGCHDYVSTPWERAGPAEELERRLCYRFSRRVSIFGGEVTCTQRKSPLLPESSAGWSIHEVMTFHDIPFADNFRVQFRYRMEESSEDRCKFEAYIGMVWLRRNKFEPRITKSVVGKFSRRI
ncbi:hypothetical protein M569_03353, partial [Genlisea aurea]